MKQVLFVLFIGISATVSAQDEFWSDITLYKKISDKITLYGDGGHRIDLHGNSINSFYLRPSAAIEISKNVTLNGGIAGFYTHTEGSDLNEFRGWQGARFEWTVSGRVFLNSFTRLEERWFFVDGERSFRLRLRSLFGITIPLNHATLRDNTWYLPLAFEVFEDINDTHPFFINRARLYLGGGYVVNEKIRAELFYIANEFRPTREDSFSIVDVIRFRLHYTL